MTSRAIQVEQSGVPAGTALVLYACLPASLGAKADSTVDAARRYAKEANCEVVAEFIDRAEPLGERDGCPGWHNALAAVEAGTAEGIVTPLMVMLRRGKADHLAAWQKRTGAYLLTSSAIDTPKASGLPTQGAGVSLPKEIKTKPSKSAVPESEQTAVGTVILRRTTELHGDQSAVFMARIWTRTTLGAMRWAGDIERAVETACRLVDNAVRHGIPENTPLNKRRISLSAALTDAGALVLDVPDLTPAFPDFDAAVRGEKGRGLWTIARLGVRIEWFLPHEDDGKTVRGLLPALGPCNSCAR